ncbi:MAG: creatininase family protein [Bacteroidota bacterium]
MRPYILKETTWKTIKETDYSLVILPWGATEAHNYHLPYGTDIYESDLISAEAARIAWEKGAKSIVLPTVPYGVNTGQRDIKLDINLMPSTQLNIIFDVLDSIQNHGLHKVLLVNSHGGNNFKPLIREAGAHFPDMTLAMAEWFKAVDKKDFFDEPNGDHADEMETSLMLYCHPQLVKPLEEAGDGHAKTFSIPELNEGWAWMERKWSKVTADTGIGDPRKATSEKGKAYFEAVTQKLAGLIEAFANTEPEKLYK